MISTPLRSERLLLVVSFACFAVAGIATGTVETIAPTVGATAVAVVGVYCVAQYATRVTRRTLADLALALWIGFLAVVGLHTVGLEAVGAAVPGDAGTIARSVTAITWATLLTAVATTTFLGFREYGATTSADSPEEQVLEGDSEYSTR